MINSVEYLTESADAGNIKKAAAAVRTICDSVRALYGAEHVDESSDIFAARRAFEKSQTIENAFVFAFVARAFVFEQQKRHFFAAACAKKPGAFFTHGARAAADAAAVEYLVRKHA